MIRGRDWDTRKTWGEPRRIHPALGLVILFGAVFSLVFFWGLAALLAYWSLT